MVYNWEVIFRTTGDQQAAVTEQRNQQARERRRSLDPAAMQSVGAGETNKRLSELQSLIGSCSSCSVVADRRSGRSRYSRPVDCGSAKPFPLPEDTKDNSVLPPSTREEGEVEEREELFLLFPQQTVRRETATASELWRWAARHSRRSQGTNDRRAQDHIAVRREFPTGEQDC